MKNNKILEEYIYKGHNIFICDNEEDGIFAAIYLNGVFVDCSPFRNDIESAKECAENIIDI